MRAGVIGLGIGERHVRDYLAHPDVSSVIVCDLDMAKAQALASEFDWVEVAEDAAAIIDDQTVEVISICSYDDAHHEQIMRAIDRDLHIYAEKPICQTEDQMEDIRQALGDKPELKFSSNMVLRTCPLFVSVREALGRGEMGTIFSLDADYLWGRTAKLTDGWRGRMEHYSVIQGAAVHMIDLVMWLTGDFPKEVMTWGNNLVTAEGGFRFDDFASISLRFNSGMVARIGAYGGCMHPHFHRLSVFGSAKSFKHDLEGSVWLDSCEPNTVPKQAQGEYPGREWRPACLHSFLDAVQGKAEPLVRDEEVFDVMAVCFAAELSAQEGKPVPVQYER